MALSRQFSLSVELTKLLPLGPLAKVAGGGLLSLLREMRDEGYDAVTEEDLAEVFGRNRIDPKFKSTFQTAIKHSAVHKIVDIAELMLEAGAGPTVRRSLKEPAYLSSVVQLSLLTWTHEMTSLSRSLAQALERRAKASNDLRAPPRYDALKGTLRACREQTSGFMWELIISAVDRKLASSCQSQDVISWYERRAIPLPVLQALLDGFTAVQHLPQATLIRIRTFTGISTLVVWAHHVLGLTVVVQPVHRKEAIKFGDGPESVHIDAFQSASEDFGQQPSAVLVNETDDLLFEVEQSTEDVDLLPACRHPIAGYGLRLIESKLHQPQAINSIVYTVTTSCLRLIEDKWQAAHDGSGEIHRGSRIFPAVKRVLRVANMMFSGHEMVLENVENQIDLPCLLRSQWEWDSLPNEFQRYIENSPAQSEAMNTLERLTYSLAHILLILSMFENVEKYPALPIDVRDLKKELYLPFRLPKADEALASMRELLVGLDSSLSLIEEDKKAAAAAVSSWGWCICLGSMTGNDASKLYPSLAVLQGVPRREGERKRLIVDGASKRVYYERKKRIDDNWEIAASPGESVALGSWTRPEKTKYYIAVSDIAFEVAKVYSCRSVADPAASREVTIGFRTMQDAYWGKIHLPACDHPIRTDQYTTLPPDTWAFRGFGRPYAGSRTSFFHYQDCKDGSTHVALVAGDDSARWITIMGNTFDSQLLRKYPDYSMDFLRHPDCCFECAINYTASFRRGRHVGLIL